MIFLSIVLSLFGFVFFGLYERVVAPLVATPLAYYSLIALGCVLLGSILWWFLIYVRSRGNEVKPYERVLEKITHLSLAYLSQLIFLTVIRDLLLIVSDYLPIHFAFLYGPHSSYWIVFGAMVLLGVGMIQALRTPAIKKIKIDDNLVVPLAAGVVMSILV